LAEENNKKQDTTGRFTAKRAAVYDNLIRQVVPGYDVAHDLVKLTLSQTVADQAQLLCVGAGTGHEVTELASVCEGWNITGVEPSENMAQAAVERLKEANIGDRAKVITGYTHDLPAEQSFDAAVMMLVMHFIPDDGGKLKLLQSIADRLKPGAPLIFLDLHADPESERFETFSALWRQWQLHAGMPEHQVDKGFRTLIKDIHFVPRTRVFELLKEAGFSQPRSLYSALMFGGWITRKSA